MYCTKCGKEIDYDSMLCLECTAALAIQAKQEREAVRPDDVSAPFINPVAASKPDYSSVDSIPVPTYTADFKAKEEAPKTEAPQITMVVNTRKEGLGRAIISASLSLVNCFVFGLTIGLGAFGLSSGTVLAGSFLIALSIFSLILGIKSIKTFKNVRRAGYPAPIATLILGIVGVATTGYILLMALVALGDISIVSDILGYDYYF